MKSLRAAVKLTAFLFFSGMSFSRSFAWAETAATTTSPSALSHSTLVFPKATWANVPAGAISASCKESLDSATKDLKGMGTTALMAAQGGKVLFSYGRVHGVSYIASMRKSVLAILYGKYVANGTINLDRTLADIGIDEPDGLLPIEREARIRNLISARSGVFHPASNAGDSSASAPARGSVKPGTYFLYNNWDFNAAGGVFESLTKQSIYRAFLNDIAIPLHMQDFNLGKHKLEGDEKRSKYLAYHFHLSTRDIARIGHLMLAEGRWENKQIVPSDWIKTIVQTTTPSAEMHPLFATKGKLGYGYMWWILEEPESSALAGAYAGMGAYGQYLLVIPKRQMVIAHKVDVLDGVAYVKEVGWKEFLDVARKLGESSCGGGA